MPAFRQATIQKAQELSLEGPLFLDTETTGLHNTAEIIEICIIGPDGQALLDSLVRPRRSIPPNVVRVHGITDEMVRGAPTWLHLWPRLEAILRGGLMGAYNAEFDLRMFQQSHQLNGMPWRMPPLRVFDVMKLYMDFSGAPGSLKLEEVGRQCGITLPNSHRARDDALLALEVFLYIARSS